MLGQAGNHPTTAQANHIVLASCAKEFPNATLFDIIGELYPLASARAIFVSRVVDNTEDAGFQIQPAKIPTGDSDTLGAVSAALVADAESGASRAAG